MSSEQNAVAPPPLIITTYDLRFPVLEQKSLPCSIPLAAEDAEVVAKMAAELANMGEDAVGLAAVQIGIARQVFVMRRNDGSILTCINPVIVSQSKALSRKPEGCLSLPKMLAVIARPKSITLSYQDAFGFQYETEFRGMEAKIVAHEMEHLNGCLITRHIESQMIKAARLRDERKQSIQKEKLKRRRMAKIHKRMNRRK